MGERPGSRDGYNMYLCGVGTKVPHTMIGDVMRGRVPRTGRRRNNDDDGDNYDDNDDNDNDVNNKYKKKGR